MLAQVHECVLFWLIAFPFLGFIGLSNGEMIWRHMYQPNPWTLRVYMKVSCLAIPIVCAAFTIHWSIAAVCAIYFALTDFYITRWCRVFQDNREPDRASPVFVAILSLALQAWFIFGVAAMPVKDGFLVPQQFCALGSFVFFGMFNDLNYVAHLKKAGRFPAQGNSTFQISLLSILLLTLAVALWTAIIVWWCRNHF